MANESTDDKSQNPGSSEPVRLMAGDEQEAKADATNETSPKSVFVNTEPMREEQVQNAVKFLSHPKVRGSPVMYRRSFLEKKGLTKEEIDEAFRRVPDPPPNATSAPVTTSNQATDTKPQVSAQTPQPAVAPIGGVAAVSTMPRSRFHWAQAALAVGLLAASGAGTAVLFKNAVIPRLKSWIRKVVTEEDGSEKKDNVKPTLAEEAAAAAKAAAVAAADVARASQEMLNSKNEERKYFEAFMSLLDVQVEEMKSMGNSLRKLEAAREDNLSSGKHMEEHLQYASGNGPSNNTRRVLLADQVDSKSSFMALNGKVNGTANGDLGSVRPSSAPPSMVPPPHPKSYMEIMAMVQRGEKPPGIKEINDKPPNPNQLPSNPRLAPRIKPWEVAQPQQSSTYGFQPEVRNEGLNFDVQDNRHFSQINGKPLGSVGDSSEHWWLQKGARITEIDNEQDDQREASYGTAAIQRPLQRSWVPPQPPPVAMPEAAVAIRQPKQSVQKEMLSDEQLMKRQDNGNDEMELATKASGSAVEVESFDGVAGPNRSNEIQEERADGIEVN
ncbi:peroxisomal membrane protein PEX14 isoform X2 [Magnolia sinica]|uniref:peroxisomal membrane protein PEX14 isoform X2 n=1 Tax=Magnolia sinica TaxID=86752 RepID=UPI00265A7A5E|nr:peroxisomal membrane protein PEX14 isoform X2 [Magnolia sinica]